MWCMTKLFPPRAPCSKVWTGETATKKNDNGVQGAVIGKLGGAEAARGLRVGAGAVLIAGIYMRTVVEAARVPVCSERALENFSLSLIRARDCSCPRLKKLYDLPMPTLRSGLEWGLTMVVWPAGVDIVSCEQ